jgi:hypothetical protein
VNSIGKRDSYNMLGLAGLVVAGIGLVLAYLEYIIQGNC